MKTTQEERDILRSWSMNPMPRDLWNKVIDDADELASLRGRLSQMLRDIDALPWGHEGKVVSADEIRELLEEDDK